MTERRNFRRPARDDYGSRPRRQETPMSDTAMDQAYGQMAEGGFQINWNAFGVIGSFLFSAVAVIVYGVNMNASINQYHAMDAQAIATAQAAITQLQTDEKEDGKQRIEMLLHLQSIDQTLKDWTHPPQVLSPPTGNTIINTGPAQPTRHTVQPQIDPQ